MRSYKLPAVVLVMVLLTYLNHFHNGFHFDDSHTVVDNPMIRRLSNIPLFWQDGRTFSVLPSNQGYRPTVSTSLAIDYWIGGGLHPWAFHVQVFLIFLIHVVAIGLLSYKLFSLHWREDVAWHLAWATALIYGVHPVCAETINYIIQRADLFVAVGLTAGLALYAWRPDWRPRLFYMVPFLFGGLSKPTALCFPFLVLTYVYLFETPPRATTGERWAQAFKASLPSLGVAILLGLLHKVMTPPSYTYGGVAGPYRMTQPWVALTTVWAFFWPMHLTADTDMQNVSGLGDPRVAVGFTFLALWIGFSIWTASRANALRPSAKAGERDENGHPLDGPDGHYRTISFGMWWFFITMLPTSLAPLAEVTNDHRMFLPLVGLVLCAVSIAYLLVEDWPDQRIEVGLLLVSVAFAFGTIQRNKVWHDDESLWADVVKKSPTNGRALMNYGLVFMARGQYEKSQKLYDEALKYTPNYSNLEVNLGINLGAMKRDAEAEKHFRRALQLDPNSSSTASFYSRYLFERGREEEGRALLLQAHNRYPYNHQLREALAERYRVKGEWQKMQAFVQSCLQQDPTDPTLLQLQRQAAQTSGGELARAEADVKAHPTPENWLQLSFAQQRSGRIDDGLKSAQEAIKLRPNFAEAYNDISAAYLSQQRWPEAIAAAQKAIELNPNLQIARNNLAWAQQQLQAGVKPGSTPPASTPPVAPTPLASTPGPTTTSSAK